MKGLTDRGAVAVEFAIVLPVLLLALAGIVEFGRVFNAQIVLTNAAREGARTMAITGQASKAESSILNAAISLSPAITPADYSITPDCVVHDVSQPELKYSTVTISYPVESITGLIGPIHVGATGVARCDG
jgi:Flp pilus assembly protein TadG